MAILVSDKPLSVVQRRINWVAMLLLGFLGIALGLRMAKQCASISSGYEAGYIYPVLLFITLIFVLLGIPLLVYWRTRWIGFGSMLAGVLNLVAFGGGMRILLMENRVAWRHPQQMVSIGFDQKSSPVISSAAWQVEPETTNFVYYVDAKDNSFTPLERAMAQMSASSNSLTGKLKGQMVVEGQKSPVRLKLNRKAEFEVRLADPSQNVGVVFERFETKDGKRILKFVKDPKPSNRPDRPGLLEIDTSPFGKSSKKLSVPYDLPPGEYGITISARGIGLKVYCFGVDPL